MGHYGGRGTMAAAMVHRVFAISMHGCCLLCYKCTDSYMKKGGQIKMRKSSFFATRSEQKSANFPRTFQDLLSQLLIDS